MGSFQSSFQSLKPSINPAVSRDLLRSMKSSGHKIAGRRTDAGAEEEAEAHGSV
jgi:hypothetical protein